MNEPRTSPLRIGAVLLAAGGSTRLGSPKQLLSYGGATLLRQAAETALATNCRPVIAVLGAGAERLRGELAGLEILTAENPAWERGMGSSLRVGLSALLEACGNQPSEGALFLLCDQPLVTASALEKLMAEFCPSEGRSMVAAGYGDSVGVPAVVGREHFAELLALPEAAGAKKLLLAHRARLVEVALPEAAVDIDTREQYERLISNRLA